VIWESVSQAGARGGGSDGVAQVQNILLMIRNNQNSIKPNEQENDLSPSCTKKQHFLEFKNAQVVHTLVTPALMKFQNDKEFPCMLHLLLQSFTKVDHLHAMIENFTSKYNKSQNAYNLN
jgi:hypothetical protein